MMPDEAPQGLKRLLADATGAPDAAGLAEMLREREQHVIKIIAPFKSS
jgi:hypothetical protein